jgi:hypothetical protein
LRDVVGIDEKCGVDAEGVDLSLERRLLIRAGVGGVHQGERVRAGAQRGHGVAALRLEI